MGKERGKNDGTDEKCRAREGRISASSGGDVRRVAQMAREASGCEFWRNCGQVTPRRRVLMGKLLKQLAVKADERLEAPRCEECGEAMSYRGNPERQVGHREGEVEVERAYYYCDHCAGGLFPPRPPVEAE
jgi:hypothetical protein